MLGRKDKSGLTIWQRGGKNMAILYSNTNTVLFITEIPIECCKYTLSSLCSRVIGPTHFSVHQVVLGAHCGVRSLCTVGV